jgi:hypothetical protein
VREVKPETLVKILHPKKDAFNDSQTDVDMKAAAAAAVGAVINGTSTTPAGLVHRGHLISTYGHEYIKTADDVNEIKIDALKLNKESMHAQEEEYFDEQTGQWKMLQQLSSAQRAKILRDKRDKNDRDKREEASKARRIAKLMKYLPLRQTNEDDDTWTLNDIKMKSMTRPTVRYSEIKVPHGTVNEFKSNYMATFNGKLVYTIPRYANR